MERKDQLFFKKKVVILGGSSGIGKAAAERFAREGWLVLVGSSNLKRAQDVVDQLEGEGHLACQVDVRNGVDIDHLSETVQVAFGSIDALVNSVGVSKANHSIDSEFAAWDDPIQTMLYGTVRTCRGLVPLMKDGGRIVHITSIHQDRVENGSSAYGMAKAAITQFTRSLALELASKNILANTIAPGFINTPMSVKADGNNELDTKWFKDNYIDYHHLPLKRPGEPEEVSGVVYFLTSSDASYITGSVIIVDGGLTVTF